MFKNLKNISNLIKKKVKKKFNRYFSDLSNKEERFNEVEERKPVIKNRNWSNIYNKSRLDNIHIAAKQKNNIAI